MMIYHNVWFELKVKITINVIKLITWSKVTSYSSSNLQGSN